MHTMSAESKITFSLVSVGFCWSAAARMRDRLTHHYFDVDLDVLWATIAEDFPSLLGVLPDEPPHAGADR